MTRVPSVCLRQISSGWKANLSAFTSVTLALARLRLMSFTVVDVVGPALPNILSKAHGQRLVGREAVR